jgi:1-acyl-sn-glycerol-3-phosphate acyltransferase
VLGLFPEGTRSKDGELQKGLPGMVFLMEKSKATVVPVKMFGTRKLLIKGWGKIVVVVGKPMTPQMLQAPEGVENRREWIANRIMEAMLELTDEK